VRLEFGDHLLDIERRELRRRGEPVALEPQVFDLLVYLVENRDRVVSRDDLVDAVWGGRIVSDSAITTRINAVRRAVGDSGSAQAVIRTLTRKGVRFIAPVTEQAASVPQPETPSPVIEPPRPPARSSLLVLPFRNATSDPQQDYLTDAITADLTVDLSHMRDVAVYAAATAAAYKNSSLDIRQIGRELGVRYLVVGSIAPVGRLVRTNVELVDAASGEQLWGDRFEHEAADRGGIENTITGRIAASLYIQLVRAEGRRAETNPQPDALALRLRATSLFFGSVTSEHTLTVREMLRRAIELDPKSAEAWARLAEVIVSDYLNRWNQTGEEPIAAAEEAIHNALLIEPANALVHLVHGFIQRARGDYHSALEAYSRAIELDQNFALAYAHKGNALTLIGRPAEAVALVEQALRLNPHDPSIGIFHWILGRAHFFVGDYERAVSWLHRSVQARASLWYNRLYLISAYALLGKREEAVRALAEFNRRFSQPTYTLAFLRGQQISANPSSDPAVLAAREKFYEGLALAGMEEG
jgi:adenylate cyclase